MVRLLSKDLARRPICVNAVSPGPTGTELFFKDKPEALLKQISSSIPAGRVGEPEEIADAILWLAGEGSRWVSGQVLRVNGGMV